MNFFGHAAVASRRGQNAEFLLGAMLPDLVPMAGLPLDAFTCSSELAAGMAHHLAVDEAFHTAAPFRNLMAETAARLRATGMSRGPALGAAHVAIELLLDGHLADDPACCSAYRSVMNGAHDAAARGMSWKHPEAEHRWATLVQRMRCATIPAGYRDPAFVGARVCGTLFHRPRLALSEAERLLLMSTLPELRRSVLSTADELLAAPLAAPA